jgi:hypothetical protein
MSVIAWRIDPPLALQRLALPVRLSPEASPIARVGDIVAESIAAEPAGRVWSVAAASFWLIGPSREGCQRSQLDGRCSE